MRIIISPAKKMNVKEEVLPFKNLPVFLDRTKIIMNWMQSLGLVEAKALWGSSLYEEVADDSQVIVNLASKEYSKCIEPYLKPEDRFITCVFGELSGEKVVQKGVYAKMARGEMVRFMAEKKIESEGICYQ